MTDLSEEILKFLREKFVGKFLDHRSSGMEVLDFRLGPPLIGSEKTNTIYIKLKDLGGKNIHGDDYEGTIEMFALNGTYEIYDSLEKLAQSRLKGGKTLLGYDQPSDPPQVNE